MDSMDQNLCYMSSKKARLAILWVFRSLATGQLTHRYILMDRRVSVLKCTKNTDKSDKNTFGYVRHKQVLAW